ncbi:hypothetical protein AND_004302 [Anopheles darlingi]|uniref:Uncharacterized protein n=1 Tax=Anopheles darlingi TaxID=43151 RepID=W5JHX7_ANODA|nr:hypothetical protein AND_004302 [Anopheles darlingi]
MPLGDPIGGWLGIDPSSAASAPYRSTMENAEEQQQQRWPRPATGRPSSSSSSSSSASSWPSSSAPSWWCGRERESESSAARAGVGYLCLEQRVRY